MGEQNTDHERNINDRWMDDIRAKYEVMHRIIKNPGYDGKAIQAEAWQAFKELHDLRAVLVFADGLAVAETGSPLANLYAEDCWAQEVLREAGCWPRGTFDASISEESESA